VVTPGRRRLQPHTHDCHLPGSPCYSPVEKAPLLYFVALLWSLVVVVQVRLCLMCSRTTDVKRAIIFKLLKSDPYCTSRRGSSILPVKLLATQKLSFYLSASRAAQVSLSDRKVVRFHHHIGRHASARGIRMQRGLGASSAELEPQPQWIRTTRRHYHTTFGC
jgi:hypothetical protein